MQLPKTLKIGALTYTVEPEKNLHSAEGHSLYGQIFYTDCKILIDEKYVDSQRLPFSLWHEVIHGILEQAGMADVKEKIVEVLGYGVVDALRNNKVLRMDDDDA